MASLADSADSGSNGFRKIVDVFLSQPGLPFVGVLSAERIDRIFRKHGNMFGGTVYTTAVMVWSFLGQVLRDGKEASCQSAVARIVTYCQQQGMSPPTSDTGDYCKARAKLSEDALHDLAREISAEVEASRSELAVEESPPEIGGWLHVHDARYGEEPRRIPLA